MAFSPTLEDATNARRKNWSVSSSKSIREQRLAKLLVSIAIAFVFLTLPANLAFIWYLFDTKDTTNEEQNTLLFIITNFLESLNYSLNFYIYCAVHEEIRHSFLDLCRSVLFFITCGQISQSSNRTVSTDVISTVS